MAWNIKKYDVPIFSRFYNPTKNLGSSSSLLYPEDACWGFLPRCWVMLRTSVGRGQLSHDFLAPGAEDLSPRLWLQGWLSTSIRGICEADCGVFSDLAPQL